MFNRDKSRVDMNIRAGVCLQKVWLAAFIIVHLNPSIYGQGTRGLLQGTSFVAQTSAEVEDLFAETPDMWAKEYFDVKSDFDLRTAICDANGLVVNTTDPMLQCMPPPPPPPTAAPTPAPTFFWEALDDGFTPAPTIPQTPAPTEDFQLINAVYVELTWDIRLNGIPLPPISGMIQISGTCHKAPYRGDRPCKIHAVDERCSNCMSPWTGMDDECEELCEKGNVNNTRPLTVLYGGKLWMEHVELKAGRAEGDGGNLLLYPGDTDSWGTDISKFITYVEAVDCRFTKGHAAGTGGAVKIGGGAIARLIRPIFAENYAGAHSDVDTMPSHDVQVMNGGAVVISEPLPWDVQVSAEKAAGRDGAAHESGQIFMWAAPPPGVILPPPYPPPRPPAPLVQGYIPPPPGSGPLLRPPPPVPAAGGTTKSVMEGASGVGIVAGGTAGGILLITGMIALSCWTYSRKQKRLGLYSKQKQAKKDEEKPKEEKKDDGLGEVKDSLTSNAPDIEQPDHQTRDERYVKAAQSLKRERTIKSLSAMKLAEEPEEQESPTSPLIQAWENFTPPPAIFDYCEPIQALEDLPLPDVKSGFSDMTHHSFKKSRRKLENNGKASLANRFPEDEAGKVEAEAATYDDVMPLPAKIKEMQQAYDNIPGSPGHEVLPVKR